MFKCYLETLQRTARLYHADQKSTRASPKTQVAVVSLPKLPGHVCLVHFPNLKDTCPAA